MQNKHHLSCCSSAVASSSCAWLHVSSVCSCCPSAAVLLSRSNAVLRAPASSSICCGIKTLVLSVASLFLESGTILIYVVKIS